MTAATSNLAEGIQLYLEVIAAPATPDADSAITDLDNLAAKICRTFPGVGSGAQVTCLDHNDARVIAARALTVRRRPKSTIPRGLYDSARPWFDLGLVIGDCPRCRSTIALLVAE